MHGGWVVRVINALHRFGPFFSDPYIPLQIGEAATRFRTSRFRKLLALCTDLFHGFHLHWRKGETFDYLSAMLPIKIDELKTMC